MVDEPELVSDDEKILRQIYSPHHIQPDGTVKSCAFAPSKNTFDVSVNREKILNCNGVCAIGQKTEIAITEKEFRGCARACVLKIHSERFGDTNDLQCKVFATPDIENNNPSHADLRLPSKSKKIQKILRDLFSTPQLHPQCQTDTDKECSIGD